MAWTVGYEDVYLGPFRFECQWEVDASSEEEAFADPDATPYLLVGTISASVRQNCPYPYPDWHTASELREMSDPPYEVATGSEDKDGEHITVELDAEQILELARVMDKAEEGATVADFM